MLKMTSLAGQDQRREKRKRGELPVQIASNRSLHTAGNRWKDSTVPALGADPVTIWALTAGCAQAQDGGQMADTGFLTGQNVGDSQTYEMRECLRGSPCSR